MPGLFGVFAKKPDFDQNRLKSMAARMASAMQHYPWLRVDMWCNERFCGGRVHVGVFDPNPQPITSNDGSTVSFFDGEVYGEKTDSPTPGAATIERLLSSPNDLAELDAHFCMATFASDSSELTLVSDRFAYRPLYLLDTADFFAYAGEVKSLLAIAPSVPKIDRVSLMQFVAFGWILSDRTWWEGITVMSAATVCRITAAGVTGSKYWSFDRIRYEPHDETEVVEEFGRRWSSAVAERSRPGKMPLLLSGGLDSRLLLAELVRQGKEVLSVTFGSSLSSDIRIAQRVTKRAGVAHEICRITPQNWWDGREAGIWQIDGAICALDLHDVIALDHLHSGNAYTPLNFGGDLVFGGSFLRPSGRPGYPSSLANLLELFYADNPFFRFEKVAEASAADLIGDLCGPSADGFWLRRRMGRFTLYGAVAVSAHCEMVFPTTSLALLKLIYGHVSDAQRVGSRFYNRCLLAHHADFFTGIPWQKTGGALNESLPSKAIRRLWAVAVRALSHSAPVDIGIANYEELVPLQLSTFLSTSKHLLLDEELGGCGSRWMQFYEQSRTNYTLASRLLTAELYIRRSSGATVT